MYLWTKSVLGRTVATKRAQSSRPNGGLIYSRANTRTIMKIKTRNKPNIPAMITRPLWSVGVMTASGADTVALSVMAGIPSKRVCRFDLAVSNWCSTVFRFQLCGDEVVKKHGIAEVQSKPIATKKKKMMLGLMRGVIDRALYQFTIPRKGSGRDSQRYLHDDWLCSWVLTHTPVGICNLGSNRTSW